MKLTICVIGSDPDAAWSSLESIALSQPEVIGTCEVLLLSTKTPGWLSDIVSGLDWVDLIKAPVCHARLLDLAFSYASNEHVCCIGSGCQLSPGALHKLLLFYNFNPMCNDLLQGPILHNKKLVLYRRPWVGEIVDIARQSSTRGGFDILDHDIGVFSCRKAAWPGLSRSFERFDNTSYLQDRFRSAGSRCLCLPWFIWMCPPLGKDGEIDDPLGYSLWQPEQSERLPVQFLKSCDHLVTCLTEIGDASDHALESCLESFRRQTYPNRELILLNTDPDRHITVSIPGVRTVTVVPPLLDKILPLASGDLLCHWPPRRIAAPTKISALIGSMVNGYGWSNKNSGIAHHDMSSVCWILERSQYAKIYQDIDSLSVVPQLFAGLCYECDTIDVVSDTTRSDIAGPRHYHLRPQRYDNGYMELFSPKPSGAPVFAPKVIFLMMYNLLTWPIAMLENLKSFNIEIVLLDQGSTYQPLLDYYSTYGGSVRLLGKYVSRAELLISDIVDEFCGLDDLFVVCDPDIDVSTLPADIFRTMANAIWSDGVTAAGLEVEPCPDNFVSGLFVKDISRLWDRPNGKARYPITLYRNSARIHAIPQSKVEHRVRHLPWYIDVNDGLDDEMLYFLNAKVARSKLSNPRVIDYYLKLVNNSRD